MSNYPLQCYMIDADELDQLDDSSEEAFDRSAEELYARKYAEFLRKSTAREASRSVS